MQDRTVARPPSGGFTLIEMMVTVALIGIMAGLAVTGVQGVLPRVRATRSVAEVEAMFRSASRLAQSGQSTIWVGIDRSPALPPYKYFMIEDWNGNLDSTMPGFSASTPTADFDDEPTLTGEGNRRDRIVLQGELGGDVQYHLGSLLDTTKTATLPASYKDAVESSFGSCTAHLYNGTPEDCGFVNGMQWVRFDPDGRVSLPDNPGARFITLILGLTNAGASSEKTAIIVTLPFGLVETFSDA